MKNILPFNLFILVIIAMLSANFNVYGYDLPGNDIKGLDAKNPDQCASACNSNSNCLAWTFVKSWGRCFLKNPVPARSTLGVCSDNYNCISGLKRTDNWCGDKDQALELSCPNGQSCSSRTIKSCTGWWIFRSCTTLQTTDYFCQ
jgi:hypothetical protein